MPRLLIAIGLLLCAVPASAAGIDARADSLLGEGRQLAQAARLAAADSVFTLGIVIAERSGDSLTTARLLEQRVLANLGRGRAKEPALHTDAERALVLRARTQGTRHPEYAFSLGVYGRLLRMSARLDEAAPVLERAAAMLDSLRKATGDVRDPGPFLDLAMLSGTRGDHPRELALYRRVVADYTRLNGADHHTTLTQTMNMGLAFQNVGQYDSARVAFETALRGLEAQPTVRPDVRSSAMVNLGQLLLQLGDYAEARRLHREAVVLQERVLGANHPNRSVTLGNLARIHQEFGDLEEARAAAESALVIAVARFAANDHRLAEALETLAAVLDETGDDARALALAQRALGIREAAQGAMHAEVLHPLGIIASLNEQLGRPDSAAACWRRASEIAARTLAASDVRLPEALYEQAAFLRRQGAVSEALDLLNRAIALLEREARTRHPLYASARVERAELHLARGDSRAALDDALRAETLACDHFARTVATLPEAVALRFAATRTRGIGIAIAVAVGAGGAPSDSGAASAALDALIRSRALVLDEMARRHRREIRAGDSALAAANARLTAARLRLANLLVSRTRNGDATPDDAFASAEREVRRLEDEVLAAGPAGGGVPERAGLAEVRAALAPGDVLVSFARYSAGNTRGYAAFVTRAGNSSVVAIRLGDDAAIEPLCRAWLAEASQDPGRGSRSAADAEKTCRAAGGRLRAAVWDPLVASIADASRVLIVPDGMLSFVPFAALPAAPRGYLLESGPTLHYLSAERDLVRDADDVRGRGLLAMGGADFDQPLALARAEATASLAAAAAMNPAGGSSAGFAARDAYRSPRSECDVVRALRFEPLPGSRREVREIAGIWQAAARPTPALGGVTLLVGPAASEAAFKRDAPGQRVLHLATHGFVVGEACDRSVERTRAVGRLVSPSGGKAAPVATPLSPSATTRPAAAPAPARLESPLRLVGLAMSGVNLRERAGLEVEDGVLTAEEVASLDLSGCAWAVLSSCHSGIGEYYPYEGLLGLRRAFAVAGAGTLIASLWAVGDDATLAWMPELYRARLDRGESTADATRAASLAVLASRRAAGRSTHPFHWAAFVAVGDPR